MTIKNLLVYMCLLLPLASSSSFADGDKVMKRMDDSAGVAGAINEWNPAIEESTGERAHALILLKFLCELDPLWDANNKLQPAVSKRFVARMKGIHQDTLLAWQAAFNTATEHTLTKPDTLVLIVQQDRLFESTNLKSEQASKLLARLKRLPARAVKQLADLTREKREVVALALINTDAAFGSENFDEAFFSKMCSEAKSKSK